MFPTALAGPTAQKLRTLFALLLLYVCSRWIKKHKKNVQREYQPRCCVVALLYLIVDCGSIECWMNRNCNLTINQSSFLISNKRLIAEVKNEMEQQCPRSSVALLRCSISLSIVDRSNAEWIAPHHESRYLQRSMKDLLLMIAWLMIHSSNHTGTEWMKRISRQSRDWILVTECLLWMV